MTSSNIYSIDTESALAEEIVATVIRHIGRDAAVAYDADGDVAGITYHADEAGQWYAADLADCRAYINTVRDTAGIDSYSIWCSSTYPTGESDSRAECLADMGWIS